MATDYGEIMDNAIASACEKISNSTWEERAARQPSIVSEILRLHEEMSRDAGPVDDDWYRHGHWTAETWEKYKAENPEWYKG